MTSQGQRLKAALRAGSGRYRYDWNYPPARSVALHLARQRQSGVVWSAFAGELSLPVLLGTGQE